MKTLTQFIKENINKSKGWYGDIVSKIVIDGGNKTIEEFFNQLSSNEDLKQIYEEISKDKSFKFEKSNLCTEDCKIEVKNEKTKTIVDYSKLAAIISYIKTLDLKQLKEIKNLDIKTSRSTTNLIFNEKDLSIQLYFVLNF